MSSPLAIAAVTAVFKDLLNDGLLDHDLSSIGSFAVTSMPPDRVETGQNEPNQLNIFLYQITPNSGWRNQGLPSRDSAGNLLTNPPLAIDLHYLLSAYGSDDLNAELLLGYAMQLIHQTPLLSRQQIRTVLQPASPVDVSLLPAAFQTLKAIDLADQLELLKITPVFLTSDDLSKLWTAMQARYRPSMAYMVSVVLIDSPAAGKSAPPVLTRGKDDSGPVSVATPDPSLLTARSAASDLLPAIRIGDDVALVGSRLDDNGITGIRFENAKYNLVIDVSAGTAASPTRRVVHIPSVAEDSEAIHEWAVGLYTVSMLITRGSGPVLSSNGVPVALSPTIGVSPLNASPGDLALTVTCTPRLQPEQAAGATLIFGSRMFAAVSIATPGDVHQPTTLSFTVPGVSKGEYLVRLRVDGIDSIPANVTGQPPKLSFDSKQKVIVA